MIPYCFLPWRLGAGISERGNKIIFFTGSRPNASNSPMRPCESNRTVSRLHIAYIVSDMCLQNFHRLLQRKDPCLVDECLQGFYKWCVHPSNESRQVRHQTRINVFSVLYTSHLSTQDLKHTESTICSGEMTFSVQRINQFIEMVTVGNL